MEKRKIKKYYLENNILKNNKVITTDVILKYDILLNIYKIMSLDNLIVLINNEIQNDVNYYTINRILNAWIRFNFKDLIKHHDILFNIYSKIFNHYFDQKIDNLIFKKYLKKWFEIKNENYFILNLGEDFKNFLTKKYDKQ
jgi:hypothetical protein